jgi:signal transduction histidine kinase
MAHASRQPRDPGLGDRIRLHRDEIVGAWSAAMHETSREPALEAHVARILDWIADCADRGAPGPVEIDLVEGRSALTEVVHELAELRDAITRSCHDADNDDDELRAMHRGIDRLITLAVTTEHARVLREAQQAVRAREDMLAVVSHDLRNPLGAIDLSAAMLLQRVDGDARAKKQVETIRRSAERMEHMISDLLDMASIQAGRLALERQPEDARALLEEVLDIHAPLAAERTIQIINACELTGVCLDCDRDRIAQVFANLIGNALKFCRPGDTIRIDAAIGTSFVRFAFTDSGPGIAAHDLPHVFEPYYSAHRHAKQGTGLGLYICRGIVEAHGGTITVANAPGSGAEFTVMLPAAER